MARTRPAEDQTALSVGLMVGLPAMPPRELPGSCLPPVRAKASPRSAMADRVAVFRMERWGMGWLNELLEELWSIVSTCSVEGVVRGSARAP